MLSQFFSPYCISQWKNLDSRVRNLPSIGTFKRATFDFIRPVPTPVFKINRLSGFIFLTWLRVDFSHLHEHKLRDGFLDVVHPICSCRTNPVENTKHYLLHCSNFANQHTVLFDDLRNIGISCGPLDSSSLSRMLLFSNHKFSDNVNIIMLLLNLFNQPIVLVDLFMINITPSIFYFRFIFSAYFIMACGDTAFSL